MKRKLLVAIALGLTLLVVLIRFAPLQPETYRDLAHYAVSVRKFSSCDKERSFFDEQRANAAYWIIRWNKSGYDSYRDSGRQLLQYAVGKIKCSNDKRRFDVESDRAIRAIGLALSRGEEINVLNGNGNTALHMAVHAGNHHVVKFLLDNGASLEAKNSDGETALQIVLGMVEADIGYDPTHIEPLLRARL